MSNLCLFLRNRLKNWPELYLKYTCSKCLPLIKYSSELKASPKHLKISPALEKYKMRIKRRQQFRLPKKIWKAKYKLKKKVKTRTRNCLPCNESNLGCLKQKQDNKLHWVSVHLESVLGPGPFNCSEGRGCGNKK